MPKNSKIKITHFIIEFSIGGAQNSLCQLLELLDRDYFSPTVVCIYNGQGIFTERLRQLNITVTDFTAYHSNRVVALINLFRYLFKNRPVILHTWMYHANLIGRIFGCLLGIPIIISSERTMGQERINRLLINRFTSVIVDVVISVSENVARFVAEEIKIPREKIYIIPNGVDITKFNHLPPQIISRQMNKIQSEGLIIGAIGRPRPVKGYKFLLEAFQEISKEYSQSFLVFVGNGPYRNDLIKFSSNLCISDRVVFLNDHKNIPELLSAFDIVVSSSLHEGMSNVILEGMAAGLPVVATAVGGTPEVVIDGETGFLVPPGDPDALAEAINKLLNDPVLRKRFGQAGRKRVEKCFTIEETVRKTEDLYLRLLKEKGIMCE